MDCNESTDKDEQASSFITAPLPCNRLPEQPNSMTASASKRTLHHHECKSRLFLCLMIPLAMLASIFMILPDALLCLNNGRLQKLEVPSQDPIVAVSRNGQTMAVATATGSRVRIYSSLDSEEWNIYNINLGEHVEGITKMTLSSDGTMLLVGGLDAAALVRVSDQRVTSVPNTNQEHFASLQSLAMNNDGSLLAITYRPRQRLSEVPQGRWNHTALYEQTSSGPWTVQQMATERISHYVALADDTLVTASGRRNSILVQTRRKTSDASQPWQEYEQTIPHTCRKLHLAMALSSNGTIVMLAVQCQLLDRSAMQMLMYVLVWNAVTADYQIYQPWTSQFGIRYMPPMSLTMSEDASLTILTVPDMEPFVFHGDFWNQPTEKKYMNYTLDPNPPWVVSEDASMILLARPFDYDDGRPGGICLLNEYTPVGMK